MTTKTQFRPKINWNWIKTDFIFRQMSPLFKLSCLVAWFEKNNGNSKSVLQIHVTSVLHTRAQGCNFVELLSAKICWAWNFLLDKNRITNPICYWYSAVVCFSWKSHGNLFGNLVFIKEEISCLANLMHWLLNGSSDTRFWWSDRCK